MSLRSAPRKGKVIVAYIARATVLILLLSLMLFPHIGYASKKAGANVGYVKLTHSPTGSVHLSYNASTKTLVVTTKLISLAPNSTHPAHIHAGSCQNPTDAIKYPLTDVTADQTGQGTSTTTLKNIADGIPATGWLINVHNGPKLQSADQEMSITCTTILNPNAATSVDATFGPSTSSNENAVGDSKLSVENNTLTVTLNVSGLVPNSTHAAHIHAGNCNYTKKVLYDLSPLQVDINGNATKTMTFSGVSSIPASGWDINVHYSTDLSTQTGYNPVLCGNVTTS